MQENRPLPKQKRLRLPSTHVTKLNENECNQSNERDREQLSDCGTSRKQGWKPEQGGSLELEQADKSEQGCTIEQGDTSKSEQEVKPE